MTRYLIATYIIAVLLISGLAKSDLGKNYFQPEKGELNNALDFELLKLKSASRKMLVAQNKEFKIVLPPITGSLRFEI